MTQDFNVEEILEIACQIERNGAAFYNKAASIVSDPISKRELQELGDMEDGHEVIFERMKDVPDPTIGLFSDPDGMAAGYLRAIAANHVFIATSNPLDKISANSTIQEILGIALQAELASIAFFQGLLDHLPAHFDKQKLVDIIEEEKSHVVIINNKIELLT